MIFKDYLTIFEKTALFSINSLLSLFLQYIALRFTRNMISKYESDFKINIGVFYNVAIASLLAVSFLMCYIIIEIFFYQYYTTLLTMILIDIAYGISSFFILFLSILFLLWYRVNNNIIILLFFVSMILISSALVVTMITTTLKINERPTEIYPFVGGSMDISVGNYTYLEQIYKVFSVVSVISLWIITVLLTINFKEKISKSSKNWMILLIPLVYYLIISFYPFIFYDLLKFLSMYVLITPVNQSILFTAIMTISKPISGALFGIIIWRTAKNLGYEKKINMYMRLSGLGIFLLFLTGLESLQILSPFPPFGLVTYSTQIVSSYLILFGIYNSAKLISVNQKLRILILKETASSKLLGVIGDAEMTIEVTRIASKVMMKSKQPKIISENPNLDFDELRNYIISLKKELKEENSFSS